MRCDAIRRSRSFARRWIEAREAALLSAARLSWRGRHAARAIMRQCRTDNRRFGVH